ncbi:MAG TPA: ABC transporter permease [Gemmatimonadaceae bacterium]|jgi:ABC-2 type transport system permease protein
MSTVYLLTLRQLTSKWRLGIMTVLAALPPIIAAVMLSQHAAPTVQQFETVVLGGMLCGAIAPLVVLAIGAPAFANELEDRTLANLTLAPLPRWHIVLAKVMAVLTMSAPFVVVCALVTSWVAFLGDPRAIMAVTVGSLAGVTLYTSAFVLLGLMSTQAIGIGLLYVVVWEGFFSGFVAGARLLSIRYTSVALMHALDARRFAWATNVDSSAAVGVTLVGVVGFVWLSVRRLRRMDVP